MTKLLSAALAYFPFEETGMISCEGITYLIFALPYSLLKSRAGCARIDSYYTVSNRVYFLRKGLEEKLAGDGFEVLPVRLPYKGLAAACKIAVPTRCSLAANDRFGTLFALEAVAVKGVYAEEVDKETLLEPVPMHKSCLDCGLCEKACPTGCIKSGDIFNGCLRAKQDEPGFFASPYAAMTGDRLLGCEVCRSVCPLNSAIPRRDFTDTEADILRLEKLYSCFSAGKKASGIYLDILGKNYLRPKKLLALTLNVMANSPDCSRYAAFAEEQLNNSDERVKTAAERLLKNNGR